MRKSMKMRKDGNKDPFISFVQSLPQLTRENERKKERERRREKENEK